jgi:hypothetical protein
MKSRAYRALNFLALSLLLFAAYLNFIRKDREPTFQTSSAPMVTNTAKETVLVTNPEQYLKKMEHKTK